MGAMVFIAIIGYLIIGGVICKVFDSDNSPVDFLFYVFWPICLLICIIVGVGRIGEWIAEWIQDGITRHSPSLYFNTYFEDGEIDE